MSALYNQDFGSGTESDDDDFNPAPPVESDNEDAGNGSDDQSRSAREPSKVDDDDEDVAAPRPSRFSKSASPVVREADDEDEEREERDTKDVDEDDEDRGGDAAEGDDDEEDDDEDGDEEDDVVAGRPRKRRRRDPRLQFIDEEAEVDDEEDEDEIEEDDIGDEPHPDDNLELNLGGVDDDRHHRQLDRQRDLMASLDAEKQAEEWRQKYGKQSRMAMDDVVVPQRLLLPTVDDPSIWAVRCREGKEKEVVLSVMRRWDSRLNTREPIPLISAFSRGDLMAGHIYIEARRQDDVFLATDGLQDCYPRSKCMLIPINEMPGLLRVQKSKSLEPGMYVRIKRGLYAGDLAQVEEVETNGLEVQLRLIPRLNYGITEDPNAPAGDAKRKRFGVKKGPTAASRPPQRLFSEHEARKKNAKYLGAAKGLQRNAISYMNDTYIDGFLLKDFKLQHIQTENVNPTLEEVTKFAAGAEDGTENLDLQAIAATLKATQDASSYASGDIVEIYQGEQSGLVGKVATVHGDIVSLDIMEGGKPGMRIDAPVKDLRKKFVEGDHVKVIGGSKYHDEAGMVVRIIKDRVTLLTDSNSQEITVFSKDLRKAADSGVSTVSSKYDLYDLVQLDATTVACVIKADRESIRVLDQNGSVRTLLPSSISNKIDRRRNAVATDREGSEIRTDDTVKEYSGEQKQGSVLHIHRNNLFCQNRTQAENAGVFVVRSLNVTTVAAKGGRVNAGPDLSKMNPALQRNGSPNGAPMMPPPRTMGRDRMIGQTVSIRKGPHKGLLGIVKDATDTMARVELHTKSKTVSVSKDMLLIRDSESGKALPRAGAGGFGRTPIRYGNTPSRVPDGAWSGSRTPAGAGGGQTPAWGMRSAGDIPAWKRHDGGMTPSPWNSSSRTPAYSRDDGGRTAYAREDGGRTAYARDDGGRTAYGGSGGSGGSWGASSRTPHGAHGFSSSNTWNDGSRTPAYNSGSRTPAPHHASTPGVTAPTPGDSAPTPGDGIGYTPAISAPTPGDHYNDRYGAPTPSDRYSAATPADHFNAPTPAAPADHPTPRYGQTPAVGAPTPGAYAAPTPGAYGAPTPGVFAAETPGGWGGAGSPDDDPRYE
ncbi:transcription elongation factor Spt5 [Eremomyces bilateralis CBS 781.70]|uniref:Transcription elongation factor SPT5 n=1 Tax=Eremomyces bilateralis CBS 781.70 TaxID=1392243 RepID=A0A6G1FXF8_9PEZI|nr:transcription elongation factor Spt5 [Eremomyces bilateralis CBS 781.70]KAF1810464.1 transcription elongation factor Spt5 [Eremomyces bilateralis CBS 781.70]